MKTAYIAIVLACTFSIPLAARQPAQVRLYSNSVSVDPATGGPGKVMTLSLTSDPSGAINNEVGPDFDPQSYFILDDPTSADTIRGGISIDFPPGTDTNGNGFDDFYEVSQSVPSTKTTGGFYTTPVDNGSVTATWSRAAGSATGTLRLQFTSDALGPWADFTHTFEVLEYTGTLTYVPTSASITGLLKLVQTQTPANTLAGPVTLTRNSTNHFNQLNLLAGSLTNATGQTLTYSLGEIDRDEVLKTNYYGALEFTDGDPSTGAQDYLLWGISIDDINDANSNGIPDLSDDAPAQPDQGPTLGLTRSANQLLMSVTGTVGKSYDLEQATILGTWVKNGSVTLTNSTQTVPIPIPSTSTAFWRLKGP